MAQSDWYMKFTWIKITEKLENVSENYTDKF